MVYVLLTAVGFLGGGTCVFIAFLNRSREISQTAVEQAKERDQLNDLGAKLRAATNERAERSTDLDKARSEFEAKSVTYTELFNENAILKTDLRNLHLLTSKQELDVKYQDELRKVLDQKIEDVGNRYLNETVKAKNQTP
jgi:ABC-type transporter Mla subunit MlaD